MKPEEISKAHNTFKLSDIKTGYIVGRIGDRIVFKTLGPDEPKLIELLGLHSFAEITLKELVDKINE